MGVRFSNSYIDRLFYERDMPGLYHLINIVNRDRELPEEFWLFCQVYEWAPSRSGIWQYYEGLSQEKFEQMSHALERFGLIDVAEKYRLGKTIWKDADRGASLDAWLDGHQQDIYNTIFRLIEPYKDYLKTG